MKRKNMVVVVGLGEIGKPLFQLISERHDAVGVDISPIGQIDQIDVMHVCYPFQIKNFIGETVRYIEHFRPALTVINSTVSVGTTRAIAVRSGAAVVNSPVRGKHAHMLEDLKLYTKFVGAIDPSVAEQAAEHFESVGMKVKILSSPEATELAKLAETSYFGLMIAWAQELERYCDQSKQKYEEIISFYDEIKFFPPVKYFPGVIGGHCVMPNIGILNKFSQAVMLEAIQESNRIKIERDKQRKEAEIEMAASSVAGPETIAI